MTAHTRETIPTAAPDGPTATPRTSDRPGGPIAIPPGEGDLFDFGGLGVHWKIDGADTGGRFTVVHHPIAPRALAAPLHYHQLCERFGLTFPEL